MRRFFQNAAAVGVLDGYEIRLDAEPLRHLKTKEPFILPTQALASDVAAEWNETDENFALSDVPLTCFLMGAQDLTLEQRSAVMEKILDCACCDTVCCFAESPAGLCALQQEKWLPVVQKINAVGGDFHVFENLLSARLTDKNKLFLQGRINAFSNYTLACFQQLCAVYSSVVLTLGVMHGFLSPDEAFDLSVLEEMFQNRSWPTDDEAVERRESKRRAALFFAGIMRKLSKEKER